MTEPILDKIDSLIKRAFGFLNGIEIIFFAIIAGLAIVAGPIIIISRLINQGYVLPAIAVIVVICVCVYYCVRDYGRKKFSWISVIIVLTWFVLTIAVSIMIYF